MDDPVVAEEVRVDMRAEGAARAGNLSVSI
jgi:hypothetical protein